jgi:hypothetical protein
MNTSQIRKKLAELDELRAELLGQQGRMSPQEKIKALEAAQPMVKYGSPEHAALLAAGYGMTIDQARQIIKEREAKPELWPYEKYEQAQAMIAAFEVKNPQPGSTRQAWHRSSHG